MQKCFFEGTNSNIARLLKIDRDQQLSLQSEICPTTNVSRLLFEPRSSAFLIYKVSRKIEKLDVRSESLRKGRLTPANRHATHLVKEIEYGALAVLQLCFTDGPNDSDELQKKLKSIREHCESNSELPEIPANMQLNFHCGTNVSAAKNIVFCFTNTRQTFYEPGESLTTLREFLSDLEKKGLAIDTTTKSLYCFESDAFRCMAARQSGFTLSESIIEYCHDIYVISTERSNGYDE
ncbi:unnamed protein product, partial [Mesorhabditis belari]|uniref:Uncharacterized protein n=1 Tax=Mesorhabditis belari TaxID=2138241 RepID=A0AAF3F8M9_9BILA